MITRILLMLVPAALAIAPLAAQEGHPLVGTWHGSWGPNAQDRTDLTFVMDWDGKTISGLVNPGPDSSRFQRATLEPSNWTVRFEFTLKDRSGASVPVVVEGRIENITNVRRSITGTWTQGAAKGDFKIIRDN